MEPLPPDLHHHHHHKKELNQVVTALKVASLSTSSLSPIRSPTSTTTTTIATDDAQRRQVICPGGAESSPSLSLGKKSCARWRRNSNEPSLRTCTRIDDNMDNNESHSIDVNDDENGAAKKKTEVEIIENYDSSSVSTSQIPSMYDTRNTIPSAVSSYYLINHDNTSLPRLEVVDDCDNGPVPLPQCLPSSWLGQSIVAVKDHEDEIRNNWIPASSNVNPHLTNSSRGRVIASPPVTEIVIKRWTPINGSQEDGVGNTAIVPRLASKVQSSPTNTADRQ